MVYKGIPSDVHGFGIARMKAPMHVYLPFRRYYGEMWFKPIARIGSLGNDEYPLDASEVLNPDESGTMLISEITARSSGELFLFVNDGVLPAPRALQVFYDSDDGSAMRDDPSCTPIPSQSETAGMSVRSIVKP